MRKHTIAVLTSAVLLAAAGILMARSDANKHLDRDDSPGPAPALRAHPGGTMAGSRPRGFGPRRRQRITEEQEQAVLDFLKQHRPGEYEWAIKLPDDDPRRRRVIRTWWYDVIQKVQHMPPKLRDATIRERDAQVRIVKRIREIRRTNDPAEKEKLKQQLRKDVADHFEAEQELREQRLALLIEQIDRIRSELKERREQRDKIVKERVEEWLKRPVRRGPSRGRRRRPPAPETQPAAS
jgi:ribosomal protein S15P/S13E